ncbi:putative entry exclusion protein TrbK-alt [Altererythrobacter sp. N1]|nr:putative entry exclusion protein TrbK-alt [Altererythrobacter sp. N1]
MDIKLFARIAAIALAAVAITLGLLRMREPPPPPPDPATIAKYVPPVDPLRGELRRCQAIGVDAASDRDCMRAWAQNRRRFLGSDAQSSEPDSADAAKAGTPGGASKTSPDDRSRDVDPLGVGHEVTARKPD